MGFESCLYALNIDFALKNCKYTLGINFKYNITQNCKFYS